MKNEEIESLSFVLASKRRYKIIKILDSKILTPSLISNISKIKMVEVSKILRALNSKGLTHCITPNKKKGRLYQLTEKGKRMYSIINDIEKSK